MCDNSFTRPIAADHTPETPPNVYIRQFPQTESRHPSRKVAGTTPHCMTMAKTERSGTFAEYVIHFSALFGGHMRRVVSCFSKMCSCFRLLYTVPVDPVDGFGGVAPGLNAMEHVKMSLLSVPWNPWNPGINVVNHPLRGSF